MNSNDTKMLAGMARQLLDIRDRRQSAPSRESTMLESLESLLTNVGQSKDDLTIASMARRLEDLAVREMGTSSGNVDIAALEENKGRYLRLRHLAQKYIDGDDVRKEIQIELIRDVS